MNKTTNKYSPEVRERAVRMVLDNQGQHESRWSAILSISSKIGYAPQTLNEWVKKAEIDSGQRGGVTTEMAEKIKALERENRDLRQANEILRKASAYFTPSQRLRAIACRAAGRSSTAHSNDDPIHSLPGRALRYTMSRVGKIIALILGSSQSVVCCRLPLQRSTTTVSDFTYVATWQGFVYVAFVIDVFARRIVALHDLHANPFRVTVWRASRTANAGFVLDALEQAIHQRRPAKDQLVHHSDRGSQNGFKRSSQWFQIEDCDDNTQTGFRSKHPRKGEFAR